MIKAFLRTPEGEKLSQLVRAFDFKITPSQFLNMNWNEIGLLLAMREEAIMEAELEDGRRRR